MNKRTINSSLILAVLLLQVSLIQAQNPIIRDQFSADPTARVFNGKVYVFPSHDIPAPPGKNLRPNWFCMADYHVFSSENLTEWTDHGVIVSQDKVEWVNSDAYSMWAPDCIERNGKYYFYFPSIQKPKEEGQRGGFTIGVAVADQPEGPYIPEKKPIEGIHGIDPGILIDSDGQAYIYYSMRHIYVAKLKENMLELDSEPVIIENLPEKGLKEGPFVFERKGKYYLTFPHAETTTERLEYAVGDSPMGPFEMKGVIMDESPMNCWTNHHSIVEYNDQWYLFYHQNAYSPSFDKNRSVCADSLFFNDDGSIQKVIPTNRGVGITQAGDKIQIDRYSSISSTGISVELIDTVNTFQGWKTMFTETGAWISYNAVDFDKAYKKVQLKAGSASGGKIEVRLDKHDGPLVATLKISPEGEMKIIEGKMSSSTKGLHNIVLVSSSGNPVEVDWIQFVN